MILRVKYNKKLDRFFIKFPNSLLKKLKWKEGDKIEWKKDQNSYLLTKVT